MNEYGRKNLEENLNDETRQHRDLVLAHDAVHPDRSACGGVGACRLMRAEAESEQDLVDRIEFAFRQGFELQIKAVRP